MVCDVVGVDVADVVGVVVPVLVTLVDTVVVSVDVTDDVAVEVAVVVAVVVAVDDTVVVAVVVTVLTSQFWKCPSSYMPSIVFKSCATSSHSSGTCRNPVPAHCTRGGAGAVTKSNRGCSVKTPSIACTADSHCAPAK